jgi:photosystem II stability/assembly factor-like uncharacterized protein
VILKRALMTALLLLASWAAPIAGWGQWRAVGPYGGNARALALDPGNPNHVLLGAAAGALFESVDGGRHWRYFAHLGPGDELMLEKIAFDPQHSSTIYAAGWSVTGEGGGFFVSRNGGRAWSQPRALRGKSVQALAVAPSDPRILVAGALDGLYRSRDSGESWERITPAGHADLKNFAAVAIDPRDPKIIYAGTWHLPWKTTDGGETWKIIQQGVIDDSDVFSIILDHSHPERVFASACSGIYRSDDGGGLFRKVQGIPGTARRTRVLAQDPVDANTVYAGTTEGLFKTGDGGQSFQRITPPEFILNAVLVDPRNPRRLLIATDRGGVFSSDDAGASFQPSNDGFSERQVTAVTADPEDAKGLYAGVINDKEFGGVFHLRHGVWTQMSAGLGGRDVFDLAVSPDGALVAATNRGVFVYSRESASWTAGRSVVREKAKGKAARVVGFDGRFRALALGDRRWYAASDAGVLHSDDLGRSWSGEALPGRAETGKATDGDAEMIAVAASGAAVAAASLHEVWYSADRGQSWSRQPLPAWVSRVYAVAMSGEDEIWAATREGLLQWERRSPEAGEWKPAHNGLPSSEVTSVRVQGNWLIVSIADSKRVYMSRDRGENWETSKAAPFNISGALLRGDRLYLSTPRHGLLMREP